MTQNRRTFMDTALADESARLLRDTLWRPQLTRATRWWRAWRLRHKTHILNGDYWPSTLPRSTYRVWLKEDKADKKSARSVPDRQSGTLILPDSTRAQH